MKRMAKEHIIYLVIFGKPGSVLAMVSTLQCTSLWVWCTQTASKTWLDMQTPGLFQVPRQSPTLEDNSCSCMYFVHIRAQGSDEDRVWEKKKVEVDYIIWQTHAIYLA